MGYNLDDKLYSWGKTKNYRLGYETNKPHEANKFNIKKENFF